jgi:hypothetical protein
MNIIKILLISMFSLFLISISTNKADAQCQPGFDFKTVEMTIGGCIYLVDFCVDCGIGPKPGDVYIMAFRLLPVDPPCTPYLTFDEVVHEIEVIAHSSYFYWSELCHPINIPPCGEEESFTTTLWTPSCWKMVCEEYFGDIILTYRACGDESYCKEICEWCWKPDTGDYIKLGCHYKQEGEIGCTLEAYEVPIPECLEPEETECFIYHSKCEP